MASSTVQFPEPYGFCEHLRPTDVNMEEITWNPVQAIVDIVHGFQIMLQCYSHLRSKTAGRSSNETLLTMERGHFYSLNKWGQDIAFFYNGEPVDVLLLLTSAVIWTFAYYLAVGCIFPPLARKLGVLPKFADKFPISAWKLVSGSAMWLFVIYVSFFRGHHIFDRSMECFKNWQLRQNSFDLKIVYFIEGGYFVHSAYATAFIEERRHDTLVMAIHHIITLALIITSYMMGYLKIGVLIFVLNDISDILLEAGKVSTYLKVTKSGYSRVADIASLITASGFCASWTVNRVLLHLTKVQRCAALASIVTMPLLPVPFYFFLNGLLLLLYILYVWWWKFIVFFIVEICTGKRNYNDVEDAREIKEENQDDTKKTD